MSTTLVVWLLTVLGAVVIVLTRLRLQGEGGSGRFAVSDSLLTGHTVAGTVAWLVWVAFLIAPSDSQVGGALVGIIAIGGWWITAACGLGILARWMPSSGRHAPSAAGDSWGSGPGLSVLAHVGLALGVLFFTWAYLTSAV